MKRLNFPLLIILFFSTQLHARVEVSAQEYWKLNNALYSIYNLYVDSVSDSKLVENAITGILKNLDPHSVYIPKSEVQRANETIEGNFEGIGISFQMIDDTLLVTQTIAGCPAEKVGVLPGDKVVQVGDTIIAGVKMATPDIMRQIRGPRGSEVAIKIVRGGVSQPIDFLIIRDKIPIYSVDAAYKLNKSTGYIKLNNFGFTTMAEFKKAFDSLQQQGMQNLILDLQGNGGGLLSAAISLTDEFLDATKSIVYTEGLRMPKKEEFSTAKGCFQKGKLIVLVDEFSASASEIVSGALQDWDRALIVGRRTFGKGLVQRPIELSDGSIIRLTVARYYTPTGRCIQKPYNDGTEKYHQELMKRSKHGEFQHADSIVFPDSLRKETLVLKRPVYGGGGIMPDLFVPIDTSLYSDYHRNLLAKGAINKTIAQYIAQNKKKMLKRFDRFETFLTAFHIDSEILEMLFKNGEAAGVKRNPTEFVKSEPLIKLQMKALLARDIWEVADYFKVMNTENESLKKALEILNSPELSKKYFSLKTND